MAVVLQEIKDSDFEYILKVTTTSTNSAASLVDVSAAEGASTNPRLSLVAASWSVASQTDILWDATTNVVALSLSGNGNYGHTHDMQVRSSPTHVRNRPRGRTRDSRGMGPRLR